jgi:hypothetical protein
VFDFADLLVAKMHRSVRGAINRNKKEVSFFHTHPNKTLKRKGEFCIGQIKKRVSQLQ